LRQRRRGAAGQGIAKAALALTRLEAALDLIDHVDPSLAPDQAIVAMTAAQRFQRISDFHGCSFRELARAGALLSVSKANTQADVAYHL
jgi:hypothetical protein